MAALWLGYFVLDFFKDWNSVILGGLGGPGGPGDPSKRWGLRPTPFGRVSGAPGAAQTPKMTDFRDLHNSTTVDPAKVHWV